jgi:pimeloyl-ACP methyl ester carboxylesterase
MKSDSGTTALNGESFYRRSPALRVLRSLLRASERLHPALAARLATRIFLTPTSRGAAREVLGSSQWRKERLPFERATITLHRYLAENTEATQRPVVLLLHGWAGYAAQMLPLSEGLIARGYAPVIVEAPAHGGNAGRTTAIPQFARALEYAIARVMADGHTIHALVGHSAGAIACAYAAARSHHSFRTALIAPPESPQKYVKLFGHVFGLAPRTQTAIQQRIESSHGILMAQFDSARVGATMRTPTLLIPDHDDRAHAIAASQQFAQHCKHARLVETRGLGHMRILRDKAVIDEVASFVANV